MKDETRSFYRRAVRRAVEQVVADLDQALDLEALARGAALSPFHFHRIFRGMVGETPLELHRRLRLERAAWTLLHTDAPVTTVAFAAGYDTHESFTRAFRSRYACSPSELRRAAHAAHATAATDPGADCVRPPQIELATRSGIHFQPHGGPLPALSFQPHGGPPMNVTVKDMPAMRVATIRHIGPYPRISQAFARLGQIAGPAGLLRPGAAMIALYHDDPETTAEAELRSDAALVVPPDAALPEGLGEAELPAGRYATATHVGPYQELGDAWARLMGEWLPASGERLGEGVSYEIYRNTPETTPPAELITELYVPLA